MALVAYDCDSTSENEEESCTSSEETTKQNYFLKTTADVSKTPKSLFSVLPETKKVFQGVVEGKIEDFIPKPVPMVRKKEKQRVKITIPSLSQFEDGNKDEPQTKKLKSVINSSGLLALLPPVKGSVKTNTSFIPKVVANQPKPTSSTTLVPNIVRKQTESKKNNRVKIIKEKAKFVFSDAESDDDLDIPDTYDDEMWEKICGRPKNKPIIKVAEEPPVQEIIDIAPEPEKPYEGLDNEAFKKLVGKSRRPIGKIKLIDINEEEILPDKDIWMAKSLTDPELAPKPVIDDPVDPTRRKKHHITYLAQQAKANEQDLKNQWAVNKNNKFASRAKYGF